MSNLIADSIFDPDQLISLKVCSDGHYCADKDGVIAIHTTLDKKIEFISFENRILAYVKSAMGYPAYYPVYENKIERPVNAVLMDLDGTSVKSENFWIWIIEKTTASLLDNSKFQLDQSDLPFVSGHSVSEHLEYCIRKYCPDKSIKQARDFYFQHTHFEMNQIMLGRGRTDAFTPAPGLKDFLLELKAKKIKIGLVTSGLYEKAWPEILSAFKSLNMQDPKDFYDAVITAGFPLRKGQVGTLGELSPKPHPWLYAEIARVGLGIDFDKRHSVIGAEDSGAGVCSVILAGFACIGIAGGDIEESGTKSLCYSYIDKLSTILNYLD